jgi:hypothetical protein
MPTQRGAQLLPRERERMVAAIAQNEPEIKNTKRPNLSRWDPGLPDLRRSRVGEREKQNRAGERK